MADQTLIINSIKGGGSLDGDLALGSNLTAYVEEDLTFTEQTVLGTYVCVRSGVTDAGHHVFIDDNHTAWHFQLANATGRYWGQQLPPLATIKTATDVEAKIDTVDDFLDTEIAAIKAKTDNLPADPADASDIAGSFTTVNSKLDTIDDFLDTEIAAIKAKTDNLPSDPADASDIASSFSTVNTKLDTIDDFLDTEIAAIKAKTDNLPSDPADASVIAGRFDTLDTSVADLPTNAELATALAAADDAVLTRLGTPAGASVSADIAAINAKTTNLPTDPADASDIASSFTTVNGKLDTIDDFLDTEVAAIKAKTDNLPTDPADQSLVEAAITAATSGLSTLDAAGVRSAVGLATANLDTQLDALPTNTELATALGTADDAVLAQVALVKAKTDLIPASPAAVGSAMTLADGAITDAKFTVPTLTGPASGPVGYLFQLWRRFFKKATKTSTQIKTYADNESTVVTTQAVSDDGTTETQGAAS